MSMATQQFKMCFNGHTHSFHTESCIRETKLSTYIWELKDNNQPYEINWSIAQRATAYKCGTWIWNICLTEKTVTATNGQKSYLPAGIMLSSVMTGFWVPQHDGRHVWALCERPRGIYRCLGGEIWYPQHNCVGDAMVYRSGSDISLISQHRPLLQSTVTSPWLHNASCSVHGIHQRISVKRFKEPWAVIEGQGHSCSHVIMPWTSHRTIYHNVVSLRLSHNP